MTLKVRSLSSGNRQQVSIIVGLASNPDFLILDEPSSGLDPLMAARFHDLLREMRDQGKTIFLSSHDLAEVQAICDRVGIIDHGKILVIDTIENLKNAVGNDVITLSCLELYKLKKRLAEESWINNIKQHDSYLTLGVKKGEEKIPVVFEIARSMNISIKSISVRKPTLDAASVKS